MSETKSSSASGGIGLCGLVFIVFLIMKLAQIGLVADWSWWWVTAPLWLPSLIVLFILLIMFLSAFIFSRLKERKMKKENPDWIPYRKRKKQKSQFIDKLKEAQKIQDQKLRK